MKDGSLDIISSLFFLAFTLSTWCNSYDLCDLIRAKLDKDEDYGVDVYHS